PVAHATVAVAGGGGTVSRHLAANAWRHSQWRSGPVVPPGSRGRRPRLSHVASRVPVDASASRLARHRRRRVLPSAGRCLGLSLRQSAPRAEAALESSHAGRRTLPDRHAGSAGKNGCQHRQYDDASVSDSSTGAEQAIYAARLTGRSYAVQWWLGWSE